MEAIFYLPISDYEKPLKPIITEKISYDWDEKLKMTVRYKI